MFVSAHQAVAAGPYIEQLYCNYRVLILAHLMRIVHDRELAEDLCQETFIKARLTVAVRPASASRLCL